MPYVRVWIYLIWSTKNRQPFLEKEIRSRVLDHIKENAAKKDIHVDAIGGYLDYVHVLISLGTGQTIFKIMQLLKGESSHWVNKNSLIRSKFEWQDDYFAASVSESGVEEVRRYIQRQVDHHQKNSFIKEYEEFVGSSE